MLRKIAFLCALCALPAAGQDRLLGTWEYSTDSIEGFGMYWEHFDTLEELADLEKFFTVYPSILKEQLSFAGTYQLAGQSLSLSSSWDSMERIRVYARPAGATAVAPISWGALKAGW